MRVVIYILSSVIHRATSVLNVLSSLWGLVNVYLPSRGTKVGLLLGTGWHRVSVIKIRLLALAHKVILHRLVTLAMSGRTTFRIILIVMAAKVSAVSCVLIHLPRRYSSLLLLGDV